MFDVGGPPVGMMSMGELESRRQSLFERRQMLERKQIRRDATRAEFNVLHANALRRSLQTVQRQNALAQQRNKKYAPSSRL